MFLLHYRLLEAETHMSELRSAQDTCFEIINLLQQVREVSIARTLLVGLYTSIANMYFCRHEYEFSETYAKLAIQELDECVDQRYVVFYITTSATTTKYRLLYIVFRITNIMFLCLLFPFFYRCHLFRTIIDALRVASMVCTAKKEYETAHHLVSQALHRTM